MALLLCLFQQVAQAKDYYVSKQGDDGASGEAASPVLTISRGLSKLSQGDTLWVDGGVYHEVVVINTPGVVVRNVAGQRPVIDGDLVADGDGYFDLPAGDDPLGGSDTGNRTHSWDGLVDIRQPGVTFGGFEVVNSKGRGIRVVAASGSTVKGARITDVRVRRSMGLCLGIWGTGAGFGSSAGVTIEGSLFEQCAYREKFDGYGNNWTGAVSLVGAEDVTLRDNIVRYSWGDGLLVDANWHRSRGALIEGNFFYDCYVSLVYLHATSEVVFRNNFTFVTAANPVFDTGSTVWGCIQLQAQENESYNHGGTYGISDVAIYNNVAWGCASALVLATQAPGAYLNNVRIFNNTLLNLGPGGVFKTDHSYLALYVDASGSFDVKLSNNILATYGTAESHWVYGSFPAGLVLQNNLWTERPSGAQFAADLEAADIRLFGQDGSGGFAYPTTWTAETLAEHRAVAEWVRLRLGSPAIDAAVDTGEMPQEDYFGVSRPQGAGIDIGACEYADDPPAEPDAGSGTSDDGGQTAPDAGSGLGDSGASAAADAGPTNDAGSAGYSETGSSGQLYGGCSCRLSASDPVASSSASDSSVGVWLLLLLLAAVAPRARRRAARGAWLRLLPLLCLAGLGGCVELPALSGDDSDRQEAGPAQDAAGPDRGQPTDAGALIDGVAPADTMLEDSGGGADPAWAQVTIDEGGGDPLARAVQLENSLIRVRYAHFHEGHDQHAIQGLWLMQNGSPISDNMAGRYIDACAHRGLLAGASIVTADSQRTIVQLRWLDKNQTPSSEHSVARITLYRDQPFIQIDQTKGNFPNIVDIGGLDTGEGAQFVIHGAAQWIRGLVAYPECFYNRDDDHCADQNGGGPDGDPGPLLYNGWFVVGLVDSTSGIGWGRVMPGTVDILKLLFQQGFEWFWSNHRGYLFVSQGGPDALLVLGRAIADFANGGPLP